MENTITREEAFDVVRDLLNQLESGNNNITMPSYTLKNDKDPIGINNVNFSLDTAYKTFDSRYEKFKQQRLERGFDDSELWSLDHTILKFIQPRLKEFAKLNNSHPINITEKEWSDALNEMVFAVDYYLEHDMPEWEEDEYKNFKHDENGDLIPTADAKRAEKGWELFHENFFGLWD